MDSDKKWQSTLEEQKRERLRMIKEKWRFEQELEKKHNKRKLRMIEEYERNRAKALKNCNQKPGLQHRSNTSQQSGTRSPDYEHSKEWKSIVIDNGPESIINKEELYKIKKTIKGSNLLMKDTSTSKKIERDIISANDIILPRRQNEGCYPIFKGNKIKIAEETWTITRHSQHEFVSEKQMSNKKSDSRRSPDNKPRYYRSYNSTTHRTDDDDKYICNRRSRSIKDSKEEGRNRNERSHRSLSRYSSHSTPERYQSRSRYRRCYSPTKEAKGKRIEDKRKFSSGRNCDRPREENNASLRLSTNYSFSNNFHNLYSMRLPGPIHVPIPMPIPMPMTMAMSRGQAPPVLMPMYPGLFSPLFPPMNMYRCRKPPLRLQRN
ncbi:uncharacterized protein LOC105840870 isoform X2 [Monomorium pharaonis]|nr:uncharacterized protein LOC105840870 isoform X2 [Monomorium pharaonis]XP_036151383.1 uncharacterized protein LOC105840870 isoform X2 [Monomorium pharaonis]XP_036151384.1 uncharacterized protein LOC105840870 isoform X2 [Monomorium pharaonis]